MTVFCWIESSFMSAELAWQHCPTLAARAVVSLSLRRLAVWVALMLASLSSSTVMAEQPGSLDASFDPGSGVNQSVYTVAVQGDGKVLIGGDFTSVNGANRNCIARLHRDGSLDTGFDPGSGVEGGLFPFVNSVVVQADGKILIGGGFASVNGTGRNNFARLNPDGSLDTGFIPGVGTDDRVNSIVVQPDGRVLLGGSFTHINGLPRNNIARLHANGTLDMSFDPGTGVSGELFSAVDSVAVQADGKVLIAGLFTQINGRSATNVARLEANGTVDTGFASAGANDEVSTILPAGNGKVLVGGYFTSVHGTPRNNIARLNSDGTPDNSFDPGTGVMASFPSSVYSLAVQPDGKILLGGQFTSVNGAALTNLARLNVDGSRDVDFDPGTGPDGVVSAVAVQPDGKVIIGGGFKLVTDTPRNGIARLNGDASGVAPQLFSPGLTGNTFAVSLATSRGKNYFLEFKNSLTEVIWTALPPVAGDGSVRMLTDSTATGSQRIYRVRME